jgi:hypothetical protein
MAETAGAIGGIFFQSKAIEEQKKALKMEQRARENVDARERRRAAREVAQQKGAMVNVAAQIGGGQGAIAGSGLTGGQASLQNQFQSGVSFQAATQQMGRKITQFNLNAAKYMNYANISQGIGQIAGDIGKKLAGGG